MEVPLCDQGSTFLGLCNRLIGVDDFEKLVSMAIEAKDTEGVDLLFKDYFASDDRETIPKATEKYVCISLANIAQMTPEQVAQVE